jgi:ABC-type multidrug transport system ATPase subunit
MINSTGKVFYQQDMDLTTIPEESVYQYVSIAAPYVELIEEMTLIEFLAFHNRFKPFIAGLSVTEIIEEIELGKTAGKQIRYFSSGMKQRVKLAQAIFSNTPCLFLDEPCTNFDENGFKLYHQLMEHYGNDRLVVISSNDRNEYSFADKVLNILDYK